MNVRELAAAYLLGELDEREAAEFDRRLGSDPALRAEVEAMRSLLAELEQLPAGGWPGSTPAAPAATVGSLPAAAVPAGVDSPAPPAPAEASEGSHGRAPVAGRRLWSLRPAFAVAALVVALVLGGGIGAALDGGGSGDEKEAPAVALSPLSASSRASGEVAMPGRDEMVLTVSDVPPSQRGQYYELWLLDADGETVPVASFRVGADGTANLRLPLPVDPARYRYFDISRQHAGQGTEHSADSVLRGPTSPS